MESKQEARAERPHRQGRGFGQRSTDDVQGTVLLSSAEDTQIRKSPLVSEEHTGQPLFGGQVAIILCELSVGSLELPYSTQLPVPPSSEALGLYFICSTKYLSTDALRRGIKLHSNQFSPKSQ